MDTLSVECLINYNIHISAQVLFVFHSSSLFLFFPSMSLIAFLKLTFQANLLASKSLQRMIIDKEELQYDQDQLVKRLPTLEVKLTQMKELETW